MQASHSLAKFRCTGRTTAIFKRYAEDAEYPLTLTSLKMPARKPLRLSSFTAAVIFALTSYQVSARTFYVDATYGDDARDGLSKSSAWKSIHKVVEASSGAALVGRVSNDNSTTGPRSNQTGKTRGPTVSSPNPTKTRGFLPGDKILFRRGQTFETSENLSIEVNGTHQKPVVIGAYGEGSRPRFRHRGPGTYDTVLTVSGTFALLRHLAFADPDPYSITEIGLHLKGTGHRVAQSEFSGVGIGVRVEGMKHRIETSLFHDLRMVINDEKGDNDDYGSIGILVTDAQHITIEKNCFKKLASASADYGVDGTAVEIYNSASDVRVSDNVVIDSNAVTEIGGEAPHATAANLYFRHNLIVDTPTVAHFHNGTGRFGMKITDVFIDYNTIYLSEGTSKGAVISFSTSPTVPRIFLRKNVIASFNGQRLFYNPGALVHEANTYWPRWIEFGAGFTLSASEQIADPQFANPSHINSHLTHGRHVDTCKQARLHRRPK